MTPSRSDSDVPADADAQPVEAPAVDADADAAVDADADSTADAAATHGEATGTAGHDTTDDVTENDAAGTPAETDSAGATGPDTDAETDTSVATAAEPEPAAAQPAAAPDRATAPTPSTEAPPAAAPSAAAPSAETTPPAETIPPAETTPPGDSASPAATAPDAAPALTPPTPTPTPPPPPPTTAPRALAWLADDAVGPVAVPTLSEAQAPRLRQVELPLLPEPKRHTTAAVITPIAVAAGLAGVYVATTLLWPLDAVAPTLAQARLAALSAPTATIEWPEDGSAAVGVHGISSRASTTAMTPMASITKVITAAMVLDERPLELGEQGEEFTFTWSDSRDYWRYLQRNESALDVPVDGTLSEYQLLQGVMLGSAGNYTDFLAEWIWEDEPSFRTAATAWLDANGLSGIRVVEPTGIDDGNVASPAALLALADRALQNPVFAEIVAQPSATIPGAGLVTNSNKLINDPGVIGVKTGTLDGWNLLVAKEVEIDGVTVRILASILDQPDDETRTDVSRDLLEQVSTQLESKTVVPAGTVVGNVTTRWGATAQIVTAEDASVIGWNGSIATPTTAIDLGDARDSGSAVGTLTLTGPLNAAEVAVSLDADVPAPDALWRLTHPLELFGWAG